MTQRAQLVEVTCSREPSDAAWRRFGHLAAAALYRLAERDALASGELTREGRAA